MSGRESTVFVHNLSRNVTENHLHEIFDYFGPVVNVNLLRDAQTGISKGSAYVTYDDDSAYAAWKAMNNGCIDGLIISLELVDNRESSRR